MALKNINPTGTSAWKELTAHYGQIRNSNVADFCLDSNRANDFTLQWEDFYIDFSKNIANSTTKDLLLDLAEQCDLPNAISKYFTGDKINQTENRSVLHTALRADINDIVEVDGENIIPTITRTRQKIESFSTDVIQGRLKGYTNKDFTDVVNIGIGGSDLGPAMVVEALQFYKNHLNLHFVSNIDGDHIAETLRRLNPETTLFVVVSKTFTTLETLTNANTIRDWFLQTASANDISKHFVAVSTNIKKAEEFGIRQDNIFPMWDWVGGRFSIWSAVGLSISLAVGNDNFEQMLLGARQMDNHFKTADFSQNIPVLLALYSIWYNNFFGSETEAVIPYTQYLQKLGSYLQQAMMESNGKSVDRNGNPVSYQTGSVIWGEPGTNAQHAFFQLIHQGTKLIPTDFIGFIKPLHKNIEHHNQLMSNFFAQTQALMTGKNAKQVKAELMKEDLSTSEIESLLPFKIFTGNKPTNTILIDQLTPKSLGSLLAMYEHKIFVQGIIWNINSYDQWGVELGKQLATNLLGQINDNQIAQQDASTTALMQHYIQSKLK